MKQHIKITFSAITVIQKEVLIAQLSDIGFEGFEEGHNYLIAYTSDEHFDESGLNEIAGELSVDFSKEVVAEQNWNKLWEENFSPVIVGNFCAIRASFHKSVDGIKHDIIITPKMSFGTGHHATTYMMIEWMEHLELDQRHVLDFGTGTGVLAILAEKAGAKNIVAIDNDDWSIANAEENIQFNNCSRIVLQQTDKLSLNQRFDLILANINKNVLLSSMTEIRQHLADEGVVIMSGLLEGDRPAIESEAGRNQLEIIGDKRKDGWISLQLTAC